MISLYPSHIHISFPCSHILPYPYISHIHVLIFLSVSPVALPLVFFFIFHFCGMKAGCVFLVVFWCRCCGWFSFRPSSRLSFRPSPRFSFRRSTRSVVSPFGSFPCFVFRPAFRPAFRFVCPFGRVGWAVCGSRRFCQLVWGGRVFISLSCFGAVGAICRHVVSLMGGGGWRGGASVRGVWRSVWRGVGRVAWRGVGRVAWRGVGRGVMTV